MNIPFKIDNHHPGMRQWRQLILFVGLILGFGALLPSTAGAAQERTIAVWDMDNGTPPGMVDPNEINYLVKAIPEILISGLSGVPNMKIVERVHLKEILREQKMGASDVADPKSRINLGRMSGARYMVFGDLIALGGELQISIRAVDVETSMMTFIDNASGSVSSATKMAKKMAQKLGRSFARGKISSTQFGWKENKGIWKKHNAAMAMLDKGQYGKAKSAFAKILKRNPNFLPAKRQLKMANVGKSFRQAKSHMNKGQYGKAITILKKIVKDDPAFQLARETLKKALEMKRQAK